MNDRSVIFIFDDEKGQRLDLFLVNCLPEFSRSNIQRLIKDGNVTIDGKIADKTGRLLSSPSTIQVTIPPPIPTDLIPEEIPLDIIFEDENVLVVNKQAGMVVHPAAGHNSGTLVHAALSHAPAMEGIGGEGRPGVVHRLDKDTSGILILAKNDKTHRWLQNQFRERKANKTYLALIDGTLPTQTGRVEAPIGRDEKMRRRMAVVPPGKGRDAITEYKVVESFPEHNLVEIHPITGRTHQIRLHMAFLGCPITGDTIYGRRHPSLPVERFFLHARTLGIRLAQEGEMRYFEAPLPEALEEILDQLRKAA
ncbi:MAG: RluA family pseudouridine synthase [Anaerolineales bacterium]